MDSQTVFFIGKPGCGKGTQARLLSEKTGWTVIGSGKQFRSIAEEATPAGERTRRDIDQGFLMPHWFAMYLYLKGLFSLPGDANVIFDGFNRKEAEADLIISSLKWLERPFQVIEIVVSDEEVRRRLEERKIKENRADDHTVDKRLEEYQMYTTKAIEMFREQGVLIQVNGEQEPDAIAQDVMEALNLS
jgi:adenylate kinase